MVAFNATTRRFTMYEEDDYRKACAALYRRSQRRGWIYDQPNRYDSKMTKKGIIILRTGDRELGRYDTRKQRLIALRSV
jgi:hypothetical protein